MQERHVRQWHGLLERGLRCRVQLCGMPRRKVCKTDGSCVDSGCESKTCSVGQVCLQGVCTDACTAAVCPGNATCSQGQCGTPMQGTGGAGGVSTTSIVLGASGGNGTLAATSSGNSPNAVPGANAAPSSSGASGCGCQLPAARGYNLSAFMLAVLLWFRKRRAMR